MSYITVFITSDYMEFCCECNAVTDLKFNKDIKAYFCDKCCKCKINKYNKKLSINPTVDKNKPIRQLHE